MTGAELERAVAAGADVVVWSAPFLAAARRLGARVHVKFDSGMGRLGRRPRRRRACCAPAPPRTALLRRPDEPLRHGRRGRHDASSSTSWGASRRWPRELKALYPDLLCHTANSAATLRGPRTHFDMVRTGIAMYGLAPANDDPFKDDLRPAMKLSSYVAGVRVVAAGRVGRLRAALRRRRAGAHRHRADRLRRRRRAARSRTAATCWSPGVAAASPARSAWTSSRCGCPTTGEARRRGRLLRRGRRRRPGRRERMRRAPGAHDAGAPRILCEEVARLLETINYEVVCDVAPRVVRRYRGAGPAA